MFHFSDDVGSFLTQLILKVTIPATIFLSLINIESIAQSLLIPVAAFCLQMLMFFIFLLISKMRKLSSADECVTATVPLIANTLIFMVPFFYLVYGDEGMARVIFYYIGNALTLYIVAPFVYNRYGKKSLNLAANLKNLYTSFPLWAFLLGLIGNYFGWNLPALVTETCLILKTANVFLTMFFLGFRFSVCLEAQKLALSTIALKNLLGLIIGILFSFLFVDHLDKAVIIMGAMAPIGVMGLVYSEQYLKTSSLSPSLVSYSLVIGVIVYPLAMALLQLTS